MDKVSIGYEFFLKLMLTSATIGLLCFFLDAMGDFCVTRVFRTRSEKMSKFLLQCFLDVIIVCLGLVSGMALIMSVIIGLFWLWLGL